MSRPRRALSRWARPVLAVALTLAAGRPLARAQNAVERETLTVLATVRETPPRIALDWPGLADASGFVVYRKALEAGSWGTPYATLPATATGFEDDQVVVGVGYEYQVRTVNRPESAGGRFPAVGQLYAGIALPPADDRGAVLLLVDATLAAPLDGELARLEQDLCGDGWTVRRRDVPRQASVNAPGQPAEIEPVKAVIREAGKAAAGRLRAVFLLGRVPIPYSGWLEPDGHGNSPRPADTYYAVPDETWTDTQDYGEGNMAGDGRYDPSELQAANVKLAVGRVDLSGLPSFGLAETELLRRYLNKLHAYRHGRTVFQPLGGVGAGGLVGCRTAFTLKTLFPRHQARVEGLDSQWDGEFLAPSLWRYQEGLAYNLNAVGEKLAARATQYVFAGCWGSGTINYDEPAEGGRLAVGRAYLAGPGAGLAWVCGVPDRHFHWLAMGETIGTCERLGMANGALYPSGANGNFSPAVFRGLLGDPTLRLHVLAPPTGLTLAGNALAWEASPAAGTAGFRGYHVYRAPTRAGPFVRVTTAPVPGTSWTDPAPPAEAVYQVRAIRLETSTTGSYHNNSQGVFAARAAVGIVPEFGWAAVPAGLTAPLRVRLSSPPAAAATVSVARVAGSSAIGIRSGASLAFTPADWNVWQTVTLEAAHDAANDDVSAMLALTAPGLGAAHVGVVRPASAIQVSSQSLAVPRNGAAAFLVRLSAPPPAGRAVTVTTARVPTPAAGDDLVTLPGQEELRFTGNDWAVWRTVTLYAVAAEPAAARPAAVAFAVAAPGYRGAVVTAARQADTTDDAAVLTAYAGFGGAAVTPLGVTSLTRGAAVPLVATAAPGFRFCRWVVIRGAVAFADPAAARTTATVGGAARIMAVFERGESVPVPAVAPGPNRAPELVAAPQAEGPVVPVKGTTVRVVARDPDGDPLAYAWSLAVGAGAAAFATPAAPETAVTFATPGTYALRVTVTDGKGGSIAGETVVVAVKPPAVARPPSDAAAVAGQTVRFAVRAAGAFLAYRWFKNGAALPGMTARVCRAPPATAADHGATFAVEVTNPAGSVRSRPAAFALVKGPRGNGLAGEYHNDAELVVRTDPGLRGDLGRPKDLKPPYTACWTAQLLAPYSETFTFYAHNGKRGGKLWVADQLLSDGQNFRAGGTIALVAGRKYDVKLELACDRDDVAYFQWNSETLDLPLAPEGYPSVPAEYLYCPGAGKQSADDDDPLPELP